MSCVPSPSTSPDATRSPTGDTPLYNLLRVRHDLGTSSTLGLVYTDRIDGSAYNRVAGTDVRLVWRKIWFSDAQIAASWTRDADSTRRGLQKMVGRRSALLRYLARTDAPRYQALIARLGIRR